MSAALRLVRLDDLTYEQIHVSDKVRAYSYTGPEVLDALNRAGRAHGVIHGSKRYSEAAEIRRLLNRIDSAAVLHRKLEPLHVVHKGIMRAAWGEYAKVLAAVERLAEEG